MRYNINLLSRREPDLFDKVVHFSLYYLRYILVITQLVVIAVLFYRFKIDNDILDLKESIKQKQEIVRVTAPLLAEADKIHVQTSGVLGAVTGQDNLSKSFDYLTTVFPEDVTLTSLTLQQGVFTLDGTAVDADIVQRFYQRLQRDQKFAHVNLLNLKRETTGRISFSLVASGFK